MVKNKVLDPRSSYEGNINDQTTISANDIASYLLSLSKPGTPLAITPLKLQKLLYYVQGWHMAFREVNLFRDDFVAWDHGPVIKNVFYNYRIYGYNTIPKQGSNTNNNGDQILSREQQEVIKSVWDVYGEFDGKYLEQLTHQEEPWINTPRNGIISKKEIGDYFTGMLNDQ